MRPFDYSRADDAPAALRGYTDDMPPRGTPAVAAPTQYLAGGTTLLDLMKLDVMRPARVIEINGFQHNKADITFTPEGLRLGAMTRMAQAADHEQIRAQFPVLAQSLQLAASAQIRNMASLGGNVLQRTRCPYFRDTSYQSCNKRVPGSGCAALEGFNRQHAVLGASESCIATYPGDFAQALLVLDALVDVAGPSGVRTIPFAKLHRAPERTPEVETTLQPGELITAFAISAAPWARRSLSLKIRDRESSEFALASVAIALDLDGDQVRQARIALGGVATVPWRAMDAEAALMGKTMSDETLGKAADIAFAQAQPREHNAFKIELGKRTLRRAIREAAALEIPT
ncbi:MAG: FAD binding domain-containing protein [Pseudolabrys sp.]